MGNKSDLENHRKISPQEGADLALENDYIFMETSCLKNENVIEVFETIIETTFNEIKRNEIKKGNKKKNKQTIKNENNWENCNLI